MAKIQKTDNPKDGENVAKLKISYILWVTMPQQFWGKNLAVSYKIKPTHTC